MGAADGQRYEYDAANRLSGVWRTNDTETTADDQLLAEYRYDALGRRVETQSHVDPADGAVLSTPQVTWHIYAGLTPIEEYDVTGSGTGAAATLAREFVWSALCPPSSSPLVGIGHTVPEPVAMIDHTSAGDQAGSRVYQKSATDE